MAVYRNVRMDFWTDRKIVDDFTAEDKYFYLYLFTNPHTNLAGCYEISMKQAAIETGWETKKIESIIKMFCGLHKVMQYCGETGEILLLNWYKYNWISSESFRKPLQREIDDIKCCDFKEYLIGVYENKYGVDTVWTPCPDGVGVRSVPFSLNNISINNISNSNTDINTDTNAEKDEKKKQTKAQFEIEFEELWKLYPNKKGKTDALKHYIKARKEGTTYEEVETGIKAYTKYLHVTRSEKYAKYGSSFFCQKSWVDDWSTGVSVTEVIDDGLDMLFGGE